MSINSKILKLIMLGNILKKNIFLIKKYKIYNLFKKTIMIKWEKWTITKLNYFYINNKGISTHFKLLPQQAMTLVPVTTRAKNAVYLKVSF